MKRITKIEARITEKGIAASLSYNMKEEQKRAGNDALSFRSKTINVLVSSAASDTI